MRKAYIGTKHGFQDATVPGAHYSSYQLRMTALPSEAIPTDEDPFIYMGQAVPKDVTSISIHSSVKVIPRCALQDCHSILQIKFQDGVQVIGDSAFSNCTSLESVHFSSTVQSVGTAAFFGCLSLKKVTLNHGLVTIGCAAFGGCISLTTASIPGTVGVIREGTFLNCVRLQEVILRDGLTSIGNFAFANCDSLSACPTLPESIASIGYQALPSVDGSEEEETTVEEVIPLSDKNEMPQAAESPPDHVNLNARLELEIHTLQDELEQIKLENDRLLVQLETITKDAALELERYQVRLKDLEVSPVQEEDLEHIMDMGTSDLKHRTTFCWGNVVKMLRAPLQLPMEKFAELDACMAAHHEQQRLLMEKAFPKIQSTTMDNGTMDDNLVNMPKTEESLEESTACGSDARNKDLVNLLKEQGRQQEEVDYLKQSDRRLFEAVCRPSEEPNVISFEMVDNTVEPDVSNGDRDDNNEDDWVADIFA